jgi:hypothetical protein
VIVPPVAQIKQVGDTPDPAPNPSADPAPKVLFSGIYIFLLF